jgi:hypothetical protein
MDLVYGLHIIPVNRVLTLNYLDLLVFRLEGMTILHKMRKI